jgi:bacteriocin biosynthesis cyclodehydratase domain-containing protein
MKLELQEVAACRYRVLPTQLVAHGEGIILRRGVERLKISGEAAQEVIETIFQSAGQQGGATVDEICGQFQPDYQAAVQDLLDRLITRRILVEIGDGAGDHPAGDDLESPSEVFYWQFGADLRRVERSLAARHVSVAGVNLVSRQLVQSLRDSGFTNVTVVDHPLLRNLRLFDRADELSTDAWPGDAPVPTDYDEWVDQEAPLDCLVVTSDFGGLQLMREWNEFCVRFGVHFLPVVLQDMVGYIGPMVMPGETPCFECLWARQNSNLENPARERATEQAAFYGQLVDGYLPPMASILGDLAALELVKFYSQSLPGSRVGSLIEIDLMEPSLKSRKLLKVPRCPVCGPLTAHSDQSVDRNVFMPGNEPE